MGQREITPALEAELKFLKNEVRKMDDLIRANDGGKSVGQDAWVARNELRKFKDNLRKKEV